MPTPRHRPTRRRFLGVALLALLLAQWSALTHGVWHARTGTEPAAIAAATTGQALGAQAAANTRVQAAPAATAGDERWGHRAGAAACQLFDQLLLGQAAASEPPQLVSLAPAGALARPGAAALLPGAPATAYEARGPPRA